MCMCSATVTMRGSDSGGPAAGRPDVNARLRICVRRCIALEQAAP